MAEFRYLIVGGGMTADAACRGIRDHDPGGSIGLVGEEPHPPYARPPLSKALWQGKNEATVWRGTADLGVELVLGRRVVEVDLDARTAVDDAGVAADARVAGAGVRSGEVGEGFEEGRVGAGGGGTAGGAGLGAGRGVGRSAELAERAGLAVDGGIVVDERGRAGGREDVFAAVD